MIKTAQADINNDLLAVSEDRNMSRRIWNVGSENIYTLEYLLNKTQPTVYIHWTFFF